MKETSLRETDGFMRRGFPVLHKKGIVSPYGEMTPFVFNGKLYRVESVDEYHCAKPEAIKSSYAVIRDVKTGKIVSKLGKGNYFFDAFVDNKKVYVFGTLNNSIYGWYGGDTVNVFESEDLIVWKERPLFQKKDWLFFNHSITKCDEGYLLTVEVAKPAEVVGDHPFTFIFAKSKNLIDWQILDYEKTAYPIDRYCGGASIRYFNGYYYFFGLVEIPGPIYVMYLTRTQDFEKWEIGKYNPFVAVTNDDMKVADYAADITEEMKKEIPTGFYCSASDVDLCEFDGKTVIDYIVGNQLGFCYMAEAEYDGTMQELLENFFD